MISMCEPLASFAAGLWLDSLAREADYFTDDRRAIHYVMAWLDARATWPRRN